jgi:hypothetical protein
MDNAALDELERVATAAAAFVSGGENPLTAYLTAFPPAVATALITAARRPALPDREAVAREVYNTFSDQEGFVPWVEGGNSHKQFEARRVANRILALSPAHAEREGWVLVPREPTEAMVAAGWEVANLIGPSTLGVITDTNCHDTYRAMLSAAPKETTPRNQWIPMAPATTHNITIPEFPKVTI